MNKLIIWMLVLFLLAPPIYAAGGWESTGAFSTGRVTFIYDPSGLWNRTGSLINPSSWTYGLNFTQNIYANDFILSTGASCCGGAGFTYSAWFDQKPSGWATMFGGK